MSASLAATAIGDYRDADTVLAFARDVDVITFDHEHVPQEVLAVLVDAGVAVRPGADALGVAQDKIVMRRRMQQLGAPQPDRSEEHTSELQSLMRISYAVFCLKKKNSHNTERKSHSTYLEMKKM